MDGTAGGAELIDEEPRGTREPAAPRGLSALVMKHEWDFSRCKVGDCMVVCPDEMPTFRVKSPWGERNSWM